MVLRSVVDARWLLGSHLISAEVLAGSSFIAIHRMVLDNDSSRDTYGYNKNDVNTIVRGPPDYRDSLPLRILHRESLHMACVPKP